MFAVTPRKRLGLHADLDVPHVLGLHGRGREHRPVRASVGTPFRLRPTDLKLGRVGRVGVDAPRDLVGHASPARQVGVVDVAVVGLRRQHRSLQRDQRRIGRLQAAVDLLVEVDVLLVVVEPETGQQAQAIGDRPTRPGRSSAALTLRKAEVLVEAVAVEQPRRRGGRARRQQEARGGRALLLLERRIRVDRLAEEEGADDERRGARSDRRRSALPASTAAGSTGRPQIVVTGRPMKSRSFDGFQSQ